MKSIKRHGWAATIEDERKTMEIGWGRQAKIEKELSNLFPEKVNAGYHFDASMHTIIRMWITLEPITTEAGEQIKNDPLETSALKMMANAYTGHEGRKNLRENTGLVYWVYEKKITDSNGEFEFWLIIENAHPMTCKVRKVTKEIEQFEMDCAD